MFGFGNTSPYGDPDTKGLAGVKAYINNINHWGTIAQLNLRNNRRILEIARRNKVTLSIDKYHFQKNGRLYLGD